MEDLKETEQIAAETKSAVAGTGAEKRVSAGKKIGYLLYSLLPMLLILVMSLLVQVVAVGAVSASLVMQGITDQAELYDKTMAWAQENLQWFMFGYQVPTLLLGLLWYWLATRKTRKQGMMRGESRLSGKSCVLALALGTFCQFVCGFVLMLEGWLLPDKMEEYAQLMEMSGLTEMTFLTFLTTVILAPVLEELMLRGLTVHILRKTGWKFWIVNVLQAFLFGLMHMNLIQGIYAFLLGLLMGYVYNRYDSLWAGMLFHLGFNLSGTFLVPLLTVDEEANVLHGWDLAVYIVGVLLFLAVGYLMYKDLSGKEQAKKAFDRSGEKAGFC